VRTRFATSLAASAVATLALTGCTFSAEIANLQPYDPSDGVSVKWEEVTVQNAMLITADGAEANLVLTIVNSSGEDIDLQVQYGPNGARTTEIVDVPAMPQRTQVGSDPDNQVLFVDEGIIAGSLFPVYFQYGSQQGEVIDVPVLDGTLPEYELLVP
jgi:hypothetical protein